jgi:hypothetical protein
MPLREFVDGQRRTWQVWDTVPKTASESAIFERSAQILAQTEARELEEGTHGRAAAAAALRRFTHGREHGWLTFMNGDDKRRLSPIPDGWERFDDARLSALLQRAEHVSKTPRHGTGV